MRFIIGIITVVVLFNALAFLAFWVDKNAARAGTRRTPESTLLTLAFFGGSLGAIAAQQLLRHKTRKEPFRTRLVAIASLHACIVLVTIGYCLAMVLTRFGWFTTI